MPVCHEESGDGMNKAQRKELVPIDWIRDNPYQSRSEYDQIQLEQLAANIKEFGLLQLPVARKSPTGDFYELAFGHRRKRACEILFQGSPDYMPLIVMELTDREMFEISLSENLKRQDLNPIEKARALKKYMDEFGATSVQAAKLFGIPEGTIRGTVRLLNLPEDAQKEMMNGNLSQTKARVILQGPKVSNDDAHDDGVFDLRDALSFLLYGDVRNVADEQLFKKVKEVVNRNKQLEQQLHNRLSVDEAARRVRINA